MQFVSSWKDVLQLFKPDNAKLFGLVTLNAVVHTYRTILYYWWWLLLGTLWLIGRDNGHWAWLPTLALFMLMAVMCLAARPSTLRKDCNYFFSYGKHWFGFVLFFITWLMLLHTLARLGVPSWFAKLPLYAPVFAYFSVTTLFMFDTDGTWHNLIRSWYRGLLFVVYNLPACLVFFCLFGLIADAISMLSWQWAATVFVLFWPVPLCTYTNLYVKRVHEQFPLYFS